VVAGITIPAVAAGIATARHGLREGEAVVIAHQDIRAAAVLPADRASPTGAEVMVGKAFREGATILVAATRAAEGTGMGT
jgi:hypothetical protein